MKDIMQIGAAMNRRERAAKAARKPRSRAQYRKTSSGEWLVMLDGEVVRGEFVTKAAAVEWATDCSNADVMGRRA